MTMAFSLSSCGNAFGENTIWIAFAETGYGRAFLEEWIKEFQEANPDKDYEFYLEGDPQMTAEIYTRLSTHNEVPDLFFSLDTNWQQWAARGLLHNLDEVYGAAVDESGMKMVDFLQENIRDFGKLSDGHYYVVPWSDGVNGLIYNYTMFEQYGWEVPETVDELMVLIDEINALDCNHDDNKDNDIAPFAWSGTQANYWDFVVDNWWAQYEGEQAYNEFFTFEDPITYTQQGRVEALRVFNDLLVNENTYAAPKNSIEGAMGTTYTLAQTAFIQGKSAMIPNGPWLENEMREVMPEDFEMRMMPTPFIEGAKKDENGEYIRINASSAGDFFCIPKEAPNIDGAIEFLKFINTRASVESYTRVTGAMRPFQYRGSEVEGLNVSNFMRSCLEIYENSTTVYYYSTSPMNWANRLGKWPQIGSPYVAMISGEYLEYKGKEKEQAVTVCQLCCDYAYDNWWEIYNSVF